MTWPEKFSLPFDEWFGEDLPQGLEAQAAGTGDASETTSSKKAKKTPMAKGLICIELLGINDKLGEFEFSAAKKPSVLRSVSAKLRRPLGNVPPIGSEHYLEKVHTQTAVRAVDLSLLLISMKNQRNAEVDEHGEHSISEKATATNEPLDVWLKLWHVSHGRLRVKIIYRDFENTLLANNLPMGEDLKRRSPSAESAEQAGAAALTPAAAAEESKGAFSDDEPAPSLSPSSDTTATLFLAAVYVEIVEAAELAQHASRRARNAQVTATVGREPKEDAIECMRCSELFTMRRWKHHCRACLRVYCRNCVQKRTDVPTYGNKHAMLPASLLLQRARRRPKLKDVVF
ncbi:C2 domain-containing protein [Aureococcus anophagefferens]|nr:C2 domain-containing protein [Aureococcus anophagefferens]